MPDCLCGERATRLACRPRRSANRLPLEKLQSARPGPPLLARPRQHLSDATARRALRPQRQQQQQASSSSKQQQQQPLPVARCLGSSSSAAALGSSLRKQQPQQPRLWQPPSQQQPWQPWQAQQQQPQPWAAAAAAAVAAQRQQQQQEQVVAVRGGNGRRQDEVATAPVARCSWPRVKSTAIASLPPSASSSWGARLEPGGSGMAGKPGRGPYCTPS